MAIVLTYVNCWYRKDTPKRSTWKQIIREVAERGRQGTTVTEERPDIHWSAVAPDKICMALQGRSP